MDKSLQNGRAWHFEALDTRAGLGFVTFRDPDRRGEQLSDGHCYYLAPPSFTPELVQNIGLAAAAERNGFTPRLLGDNEELGFPSLDTAREFLRRAYVASASGDDGEPQGNEPSIPPPKGNGGVHNDVFPEYSAVSEDSPTPWLGKVLSDSWNAAEPGSGQSINWSSLTRIPFTELAEMGALTLLLEWLNREPPVGGPVSEMWRRGLVDLGRLCCGLVSWRRLEHRLREPAIEALAMQSPHLSHGPGPSVEVLVALLTGGDWHWRYRPIRWSYFPDSRGAEDSLSMLSRQPLPEAYMALAPAAARPANLQQALVSCLSCPERLSAALQGEAADALIGFAALVIACDGMRDKGPMIDDLFEWHFSESAHQERCNTVTANWLMESLPRFRNPAPHEAVLNSLPETPTSGRRPAPTIDPSLRRT